ncbi:hypothetical protein AVEN_167034-1 [Araneus ventricosus]|uniref:Uncharacterized protein n=1 Tax=Araneus ventricosus TaxID=182803 RepID=A0A4Y2RNF4_ARAVE|nr:hypothetical protein AVEN_167034-1 [Araneus ventricosus]
MGRGGIMVRSRPRTGGSQARNPIPMKIRRVWGPLHAKSYVVAESSRAGAAPEPGDEGARQGVAPVIRPRFKITRSVPKQPPCCFQNGTLT